jgi:ABC-type phosphate/phosphonate transport system substrate-binding protein
LTRRRLSGRAERPPLLLLAAALFALLSAGCTDAGRSTAPLRIGYMICNSLEETQARFAPLSAYLGEQLGREVRPLYLDTVDFEEAVSRGEFDIVHTNSLLYVWFNKQYDFRILSGERRGRNGSFSAGAIVVHADSDIRSLADLKGKRFIFGPQLAPTAFLSQYHLLLEGGVDPETDLGYYAIPWGSFKHEKVLYGVWFGKYDAGAAPLLDLELSEEERKIPLEDLRIIAEGPLIPYCVFSAPPSLPEETFDKVQSVLFGLTEEATAAVDGEALKVLKGAGVDGFEALQESDFDQLRAMARRAKLPPYAEY